MMKRYVNWIIGSQNNCQMPEGCQKTVTLIDRRVRSRFFFQTEFSYHKTNENAIVFLTPECDVKTVVVFQIGHRYSHILKISKLEGPSFLTTTRSK